MPIPDIPNFKQLLETFTFDESKQDEGYQRLQIVEKSLGRDLDKHVEFTEINLWYKPSTNLSIESLITKIQQELKDKNHLNSFSIAKILLGISILHFKFEKFPIECLNQILSNITTANLSQFFVYPPLYSLDNCIQIQPFRIGRFNIGKLDNQKLKYRCEQAGSDYFVKYGEELAVRLAVEREYFKVTVFDFTDRFKLLSFPSPISGISTYSPFALRIELLERLMGEYFLDFSIQYDEDFWNSLLEEQHLLLALGAPYFSVETKQNLHGSQFISIFLGFAGKKTGWVQPSYRKGMLDFASVDTRIPKFVDQLKNNYQFEKYTQSEIHQTIKTFALFISKAKRHCLLNNNDEGFLHYVIALDLLLGVKDESTKSVSNRAAIIVHRKFGNKFEDQKKKIQGIYDVRSKYAHQGKSVKTEDISKVESVCEEILHCLLRLQLVKENQHNGFIDKWLRNLDFLVKAIDADKVQDEKTYIENGIWYIET